MATIRNNGGWTMNRSAIAETTLWVSVACNFAMLVVSIVLLNYSNVALHSLLIAVLTGLDVINKKVQRVLDARISETIAQQRMSEIALEVLENQRRAGDLRIGVTGVRGTKLSDRMN